MSPLRDFQRNTLGAAFQNTLQGQQPGLANALSPQPQPADVNAALHNTVTNRATMLPLANYADGSTRLAWPE